MVKTLILLAVVMLSGCTSQSARALIGNAVANAADTQVGYNAQECFKVQTQCVEGLYEEWQTSDGVPGCSCKNY